MGQPPSKAPAKQDANAGLINSNVVFIAQEMLVQEAVQLMIDKNISSVLVLNFDEEVVGILTERDIVRKFTLLEMADKLTHSVSTLMTRPVQFVQAKTLRQDITKLHLAHKFRHFPVLSGSERKKDNIVGIVSITDLARQHMLASSAQSAKKDVQAITTASDRPILGVLSHNRGTTNVYLDLFKGMGFAAREVTDIHKFLMQAATEKRALILDLDGYSDHEVHDLIPVAVKSKAYLILTTSNPALVPIFKKYLSKDRQDIALKPLDMSYISWVLDRKWHSDQSAP